MWTGEFFAVKFSCICYSRLLSAQNTVNTVKTNHYNWIPTSKMWMLNTKT